jgi:hypothetical protein
VFNIAIFGITTTFVCPAKNIDLSQEDAGGEESDDESFLLDSDYHQHGNSRPSNSFNIESGSQVHQLPVPQTPSMISLLQSQQSTLQKVL